MEHRICIVEIGATETQSSTRPTPGDRLAEERQPIAYKFKELLGDHSRQRVG